MTLEKAIKILQEHVKWCDPIKEVDTYDTLKLGIEALQRLEVGRNNPGTHWSDPLPGETEE